MHIYIYIYIHTYLDTDDAPRPTKEEFKLIISDPVNASMGTFLSTSRVKALPMLLLLLLLSSLLLYISI